MRFRVMNHKLRVYALLLQPGNDLFGLAVLSQNSIKRYLICSITKLTINGGRVGSHTANDTFAFIGIQYCIWTSQSFAAPYLIDGGLPDK